MHFQSFSAPLSWDDFAAQQNAAANRRRLDHTAWAMEEQLDSFVELLQSTPSNEVMHRRSKSILNLISNRTKKHRRRDEILRASYQHICRKSYNCNSIELLICRERLNAIRFKLSEDELRIFDDLAEGDDYVTIAARYRLTQSALKSRISRCRERVRKAPSH
jgi:hypothetical protein